MPTQLIKDRYEFDPKQDELGKGGFGRVFKARDTLLRREVVLKFTEKSHLPEQYSLIQEISRVIEFNHPNLTRYYDAIVMHAENQFGAEVEYQIGVLEYVQGGNLKEYLEGQPSISIPMARQITQGILRGLGYLHGRSIIHRDIKPSNILLGEEQGEIIPKICDFGISKVAGTEATLSNVIGTFEYMSPEQLGNHQNLKIRTNSDLWSLGVLIYEMLLGKLPFGSRRSGTSEASIIANIVSRPLPQDIQELPPPFDRVVAACLVRDAQARIDTSEAVLNMLEEAPPAKTEIAAFPPAKAFSAPKSSVPKARSRAAIPELSIAPVYRIMILAGFGLILALLIWAAFANGGTKAKPAFFPFQDPDTQLYGYEDEGGQVMVRPVYRDASRFREGRARLMMGNNLFYVNESFACIRRCPSLIANLSVIEQDHANWWKAAKSGTQTDYEAYLIAFPQGIYSGLARKLIQVSQA